MEGGKGMGGESGAITQSGKASSCVALSPATIEYLRTMVNSQSRMTTTGS